MNAAELSEISIYSHNLFHTIRRYKSALGHPGYPPVPKNKFFGGIEKPRVARKGRHTYRHR